jgi:phosphatidylserine decarboxylase
MKLHREGYLIMTISLLILSGIQLINFALYSIIQQFWLFGLLTLGVCVMACLIIQFFRVPYRTCVYNENDIFCPADGKVVVIEEVEEQEYFKDRRIQVSIFMSPLNVHANYNPISGVVNYVKYHPGQFLVAWHPKSSTDNERSTMVIKHDSGKEILFRQIAGAVARRICYYVHEGQRVITGEEFGFIKFGSRIDVFLPLNTKLDIKIGDVVKAKLTKLGELN